MADRSVLVRLRADVSDFVVKSKLAEAAVRSLHNEIDKSNDRTAWLAQGILALTPAVTRLGAGAVPVLSGMVTQLTMATVAAGTMALAFNGVGDALTKLNDYQLDPTDENLKQLNDAMEKIGPTGQAFVEFLDSLGPALSKIADSSRDAMFPGLMAGIEDFMTLAPELNSIVTEVGEAIGQLGAEAGAGLSGPRFEEFFEYLDTRAKPILIEMGRTAGNFFDGFTNMIVAFDPLSADFSSGLLEMSRSFAEWSDNLEASNGFQDFVSYVREAGPDALDFLGTLITTLVELVEAAAPIGAVMLPVLTSAIGVIGDLANTPLGPLVIGFLSLTAAWGRLNAVAAITGSGVMSKATAGIRANVNAAKAAVPTFRQLGNAMAFSMTSTDALAKSSMSYSQKANQSAVSALRARSAVQNFGRAAAPVAGQVGLLALAMSDYDDKAGLTNTTSLALAGSLAGPWGAAVGGAAGLLLDMKAGADEATEGLTGLDEAAKVKNIELLTKRIAEAKAELSDQEGVSGFGDFFSDSLRELKTGPLFGAGATDIYTAEISKAEAELAELKNTQADVAADKSFYNSLMAEQRALTANIDAMREKRAEAIKGLNAELDYKASLLDARDALKENGKNVDENTRKGQANLQALYGMASAFNAQADASKDSTKEVRAGRAQFVAMAEAMGMGTEKARRLAKQLYELPAKVPITIGVDAETAMAHARAIKAELASIDKNIDIYVNVRKPNMSGLGPQITPADGTTVPGQRYPYGDKIHAMLAPGEEVISNRRGQADKNRAALKAANAGATIGIIGYADGGTAGTKDGKKKRTRDFDFATPNDNTAALEYAIRVLTTKQEDQTQAVERQTSAVDYWTDQSESWISKMDDVAKATVAGFDTGLFEKSSNPWAVGAAGGPLGNINKDIAGLQEREGLQNQLAGLGITGDALAAILGQGTNADIAGLIANGTATSVAAGFNQRAALQASVGGSAGQMAYGQQAAAAAASQAQAVAEQQNTNALLNETNIALMQANDTLSRMGEALSEAPDRVTAGFVRGGNKVARRGRRD